MTNAESGHPTSLLCVAFRVQTFSSIRQFAWLPLCLCALLVCAGSGCTRAWWRQQADEEVQETVAEKYGYFDNIEVTPAGDSRLFDPFDPDCEPMPPDDPNSHELMHCVDGHRGWKHWHDNGDAPFVDAQTWLNSLPRDESGEVVLNLSESVRVARKNSRDYQFELEDLYLSALDVTFERFRFDAQFFAGNTTLATFDGVDRTSAGEQSTLDVDTGLEMRKLTATGGELVVGLANSLMWQFSGSDTDMFGSVLDFSLVQPLLRFGGRARVLERLTQSERTLLANVRQMEQFRQGFYVQVVAGRNPGDGPNRRGIVGQEGLGLLAGVPSGRSGAAPFGGFLGVLQEQQLIRNRAVNLKALADAVEQLEFNFQAGRLPNSLQVEQTRQAYFNAQSNLMTSKVSYKGRLDEFKLRLGLPPTLQLRIEDPLIDRFNLIDPLLVGLNDEINAALRPLRANSIPTAQVKLADRQRELRACEERLLAHFGTMQNELDALLELWPARAARLSELAQRINEQEHDVDRELFDPDFVRARIDRHAARMRDNRAVCAELLTSIRELDPQKLESEPEPSRKTLLTMTNKLAAEVSDALLTQASIRLEAIDLLAVDVAEPNAIETARGNRLDWMNARANVVDAWRKIEFEGNALQSGLNLLISGDLGTRGDNPAEFTADNGRLRVGAEFDSPITRLAERNRYRETQIEFQRARRDYMRFEDEVSQSIRNTLRIIDLNQINFEVRRAAVLVAIAQVTLARYRLNAPAPPGAGNQVSPTTARDLVSALDDLLNSQNDMLNAWVSYEVLRMLLDFELGTMRLTPDGLWLDPGAVELR